MSNTRIDKIYDVLKNDKYVSPFIIIVLGLYAGLLGPNLPEFINNLFKKSWFKIVYLFVFLLVLQQALVNKLKMTHVLLIVICFVLTLDYLYLNSIRNKCKKLMDENEQK